MVNIIQHYQSPRYAFGNYLQKRFSIILIPVNRLARLVLMQYRDVLQNLWNILLEAIPALWVYRYLKQQYC